MQPQCYVRSDGSETSVTEAVCPSVRPLPALPPVPALSTAATAHDLHGSETEPMLETKQKHYDLVPDRSAAGS